MISKRSKRVVAILTMLVFLLTLVPMGAMAGTSGSISSLSAPTTKDDVDNVDLGKILLQTVAGAVYENHTITLRLPTDFEWEATLFGDADGDGWTEPADAGYASLIDTPNTYSGDENGLADATTANNNVQLGVKLLGENEIQIKVLAVVDPDAVAANDGYIYVFTNDIDIPEGASGDIKVVATSPISQGFPSGEAVVGKITGGEVLVSVDEIKTFTDTSSEITLRFKETVGASFEVDDESMKLRLPNGFTWELSDTHFDDVTGGKKLTNATYMIWGDNAWVTYTGNQGVKFRVDERDLYIDVDGRQTAGGTFFKVPVSVKVDDESVAKMGDVKVTFTGETDAIPSELVIAKYNEMGSTVSAANATEVIAGKTAQEIGDIVIEESAPDTFTLDRTITIKLPANAKWFKRPTVDDSNGLSVNHVGFVGTDGRTIKYEIDGDSDNDPGKLVFEDAQILLSGDASGKIEVEVAGTAGAEGKAEVATVKAPVEATAGTAPEVKIGLNGQAAADFVITELAAENIAKDDLVIALPDSVEWNDVPTITVEEGDILLDEATTTDNLLTIPVRATSSKPAKIKISGIKLDIDRTVPEGDIYAKVQGAAVNEVNITTTLDDEWGYADPYWTMNGFNCFKDADQDGAFPNVSTVAKAAIAKLVTPAPVDQKKSVKFVINDTKFTVNGVETTMDVAPYIKDGRTFLPVRYVAQALGVADSNIVWDAATQKVTVIKGDKVVQMTIGSKVMLVNGISITMDVAPELTSDRTMLPFRAIAQALGATVGWDDATQTVTMEL